MFTKVQLFNIRDEKMSYGWQGPTPPSVTVMLQIGNTAHTVPDIVTNPNTSVIIPFNGSNTPQII